MKTLKFIWSCWDKIDRYVAVSSIIAFILLMCFFCTSCSAQVSLDNIPDMEYGDAELNDIYDNYIPIYADGVVDFIYCTQDEEYIIEYHDDDYFDIDNLPQMVNCVNGDSVVCIYCSEEIFYEYMKWYSDINRTREEFFSANEDYYIKEVWCGDVDNGYWYYSLNKK